MCDSHHSFGWASVGVGKEIGKGTGKVKEKEMGTLPWVARMRPGKKETGHPATDWNACDVPGVNAGLPGGLGIEEENVYFGRRGHSADISSAMEVASATARETDGGKRL